MSRCTSVCKGLALAASILSAQPEPVSLELAGRARRLLESTEMRERAWGCRLSASLYRPELKQALIAELRNAKADRGAPHDGDKFAFIQCLLDALIEYGGGVPAKDILPFFERWPAEAIILLARAPDNESTILTLLNSKLPDAEWFALNNILLAQHRMGALGLFLKDMPPLHEFHVWDTIQPSGGIPFGMADIFGIASPRRFPDGFPPIAIYRLQLFPCGRCAVAVEGPRTVYYERNMVPLGDSVSWGYEPDPRGEDDRLLDRRTDYLVESLARILGRPVQEVREAFLPRTRIMWKTRAQTAREIEESLKIQVSGLTSLFAGAKQRREIDLPSIQLTITPKVCDYRERDKSPLPESGPRELRLDLK